MKSETMYSNTYTRETRETLVLTTVRDARPSGQPHTRHKTRNNRQSRIPLLGQVCGARITVCGSIG